MEETRRGNVAGVLQKAILWLFFAVFFIIFIQISLFNSAFGYSPLLQGGLVVLWLAFFLAVGFFAALHRELLYKHRYWILSAVLLLVFAVQFWVGIVTRQQVDHDYGQVYNGAVIFTLEGDSGAFQPYKDYLHHFTNNVGEFAFLHLIFKVMHALSFTNFYAVTVFIGHLAFAAAILFTFLYLNRAFGPGAALASLALYLFFLPVYFQSSIVYTDTLSIWMPPAFLYCFERSKTIKRFPLRCLCFAAIGVIAALGMQIKATVLITLVTVVIEAALSRKWKNLLAMAGVVLVVAGAWNGLFSLCKFGLVLDRDRTEREAMPFTFWVMMGLSGDGSYNATDHWVIATSVEGQKARNELNLQVIKDRLAEMGPLGYANLLHRKTSRTFGSGNGEVNYLLVRNPDNPGHWIYKVISTQGSWFRYFNNLSQAVYLSFYLLAMAGVLLALKKKTGAFLCHTAPFLSLVGFYLFMLLWESNHRQLVNQWPLFIIAAAAGAIIILKAGREIIQHKHSRRKEDDIESPQ